MKIVINPFDKKSINNAVKLIAQYEREFQQKEAEFIRRLKDIGVAVARSGFATADYDGVNDVLIAETQNGSQAVIIAYGETVGFIEFGTGVRYPEWSGAGASFTPPAHGTYGKGRGAQPHGWYFKQGEGTAARHTYGNPPAEAMLTARDTMIERVAQIAREVWR